MGSSSELVDDVRGQGERILLIACASAIELISGETVVPTEFSAADHIIPERIIQRDGVADDLILLVTAESSKVNERAVRARNVIEAIMISLVFISFGPFWLWVRLRTLFLNPRSHSSQRFWFLV